MDSQAYQQLLTVEEVAEQLRVSTAFIYRLLRQGKLRGVKLGSLWRVERATVDKLLKREGPTGETIGPTEHGTRSATNEPHE
jgi:excisionase family DNA binding protein